MPGIARIYADWRKPEADALQAEATALRRAMQAYPMIPALKRVIAHSHDDPGWAAVRPPLVALGSAQSAALIADLARLRFALGGRRQAA